ncbi:MAG: TlyA family RNA methyltransferase [Proteobacteria bacterium]|nr:TlyA family RNA methyltransferase [Pseudomonadota bacterium]
MSEANPRGRIDKILVQRGLFESRTRAQAAIEQGRVSIGGVAVTRSNLEIPNDARIDVRSAESEYVSRGALKLIAALDRFSIRVSDRNAIDVGASTGGFSEVLLQRGVREVYAVDVGSGQLASKIRENPRVKVLENYNARNFKPEDFPMRFDLLVMDVSFISIRLLLPSLVNGLNPDADLIVLFKPQFEVGRDAIGKGGVVEDQDRARQVMAETLVWAEGLGLHSTGTCESPLKGGDGNTEYLIHWMRGPRSAKK